MKPSGLPSLVGEVLFAAGVRPVALIRSPHGWASKDWIKRPSITFVYCSLPLTSRNGSVHWPDRTPLS